MSSSSSRKRCRRFWSDDIMYVKDEIGERKILGKGGEGLVYLAELYLGLGKEKSLVAVKHLKENSKVFEQEIETVSKIHHVHLVSLLGYCEEPGKKILLYEYMEKGSLQNYVKKGGARKRTPLSWQQWLGICLGAARGIQHLHTDTHEHPKGIIHRDVKPGNILLDENWVAKISDFGMFKLSGDQETKSEMSTKLLGTRGYYAPEYNMYLRVTRKVDVYAFGVVLYQVLCRKMPWELPDEDETYIIDENGDMGLWAQQNVDAEMEGKIPHHSLRGFTAIIGRSLQVNPSRRPTIDAVVMDLEKLLLEQQYLAEGSSIYTSNMVVDDEDLQYPAEGSSTYTSNTVMDDEDLSYIFDTSDDGLDALQELTRKRTESLKIQRAAQESIPHKSNMTSSSSLNKWSRRFSLEEIKGATNNFDQVIGRGGSATVYLAGIYLGHGKEKTLVAVKHLNSDWDLGDEIKAISMIRHPHVVSLIGYCEEDGQKMVVYEYMQKGSLKDCLKKRRSSSVSLSWQQWLKICLGVARGLQRLHTETDEFPKGIIHRSVYPGTILLDEDCVAKVSGFLLIKPSHADQIDSNIITDPKGVIGYYAPESLTSHYITRKIDVYSLGVVLYQVLCGKMPWDRGDDSFSGMEDDEIGAWAMENVHPDIKKEISDDSLQIFTQIIGDSLRHDPSKRPTMNQVVSRLETSLMWQEYEDRANHSSVRPCTIMAITKGKVRKKPRRDIPNAMNREEQPSTSQGPVIEAENNVTKRPCGSYVLFKRDIGKEMKVEGRKLKKNEVVKAAAVKCAKMTDLEKEPWSKAHHEAWVKYLGEGGKKRRKEVNFKTRCCPKPLFMLANALGEDKRAAVEEIGFGGLLKIQTMNLRNDYCLRLTSRFNHSDLSMTVSDIGSIHISDRDVSDCLGVPMGPRNVQMGPHTGTFSFPKNMKISEMSLRLLQMEVGDDFKRLFVMFACASLLYPDARGIPNEKLWKNLDNVSEISSFNWARLVLNGLVDANNSLGIGKTDYQGCVFFLMIFYLDRVCLEGCIYSRTLPHVATWTTKRITKRLRMEEKNKIQEHPKALQIRGPFSPFTTIVAQINARQTHARGQFNHVKDPFVRDQLEEISSHHTTIGHRLNALSNYYAGKGTIDKPTRTVRSRKHGRVEEDVESFKENESDDSGDKEDEEEISDENEEAREIEGTSDGIKADSDDDSFGNDIDVGSG